MSTQRFYRISELCRIVGLSRSGIYKLVRERRFPRGVKLTSRATGWPDDLVQKWVQERLAGPPK